MVFKIEKFGKASKLKNPILLEGLPGIGNVGKIVVDFIIDDLNAKKIASIYSHEYPHSVFVNEENIIELPSIELFQVKTKKRDFLILTGDVQPIDERASYEFAELILDFARKSGCKEVITMGGIGLQEIPKTPKVYCSSTSKKKIQEYGKIKDMNTNMFGIVGPIIGATGLIAGLAPRYNIDGVTILAETYGHPLYLGINGSKKILHMISDKFALKLNFSKIDKEIKELEDEVNKSSGFEEVVKKSKYGRMKAIKNEVNYIG